MKKRRLSERNKVSDELMVLDAISKALKNTYWRRVLVNVMMKGYGEMDGFYRVEEGFLL